MKALHMIAWILLVIGGLNWLLTGLWSAWDLGAYITPMVATIVYVLVGLSALLELFTHKSNCKTCGTSKMPMTGGPSM